MDFPWRLTIHFCAGALPGGRTLSSSPNEVIYLIVSFYHKTFSPSFFLNLDISFKMVFVAFPKCTFFSVLVFSFYINPKNMVMIAIRLPIYWAFPWWLHNIAPARYHDASNRCRIYPPYYVLKICFCFSIELFIWPRSHSVISYVLAIKTSYWG